MLGFDFDVTGTEAVRQTGQIFLEKLQPDYHMDRGATPFPIASDITDLALRYHPGSDISFLEPCVGTGIFFSAFLHDAADHAGQLRIQSAHGVEYDEQFAALAHDLWAPAGLAVNNLDFLCLTEAHLPKATLVMSRAPTTRHHLLTSEQKVQAANAAEAATGMRPTGLADLYLYFVLATHTFLAPGAVSAWLLPTAFLEHDAGQTLRTYLSSRVRLRRIHIYEPGALGTTGHDHEVAEWSLVLFTNEPAKSSDTFPFSAGGQLYDARTTVQQQCSRLDPETSWHELAR